MATKFELTEQDYRYLFENANDFMYTHDLQGNFKAINRSGLNALGYTIDEALNSNIKDVVKPEFAAFVQENIIKTAQSGIKETGPYEIQVVSKSGDLLWLEIKSRLILEKDEPVGVQSIARDITQRKTVEEMLSKIIDGSSIPSFVINKQHKVTYWNTAIEALIGIKKEEIVGTDEQWRVFYSEKRPSLADLIMDEAPADKIEVYYQGKCKKSPLIDGAYEVEDYFPDVGRDGKWLHFTASPIKDDSGRIIAVIETLQDITERKNAEEALQESEKSFRGLFEGALDAIWVHDLKGSIQAVNKAAAQLSGYSVEELLQMNVKSFISGESLNLAREVQDRLIRHQPVDMPYEQRMIRKDGSEATCMFTTNLMTIDDKPKGFQNIVRDITEERQLQENMRFYVQQITRAQEEERKRIARELHDEASPPLLLLIQRLDTITSTARARLSQPLKDNLEELRRQAVETLEGLRRCAQDLRPRILDDLGLVAALEWMADDLAKTQETNAHVEMTGVERTLPAETQLLLFRIAQEAFSNTRRHAQASRAVVKLEFRDDSLRMTVSDNGKGFEVPERIGDLASIGQLGLAGMQERARLIGGRLKIQSGLGKGTTVTVEVPL